MDEAQAARQRLSEERAEIAQLEKEPLRRRLLVALATDDGEPKVLAQRVEAEKESVSRKLSELRAEGLVRATRHADDRRRVIYSLTPAGRSEMGRHLALGASEPPSPLPDRKQLAGFVREAIDGAIAMRRRRNRLDAAIDRLEEIYRQCRENGLHELALEALAELATTQRQARRRDRFEESLAILEGIASGTAAGTVPTLVLPAAAYLEYERGRSGDLDCSEEAGRVERLSGARSLFGTLLADRQEPEGGDWARRRAWSVASLAGVRRRQTRYEEALEYAAQALHSFEALEDAYGTAHCWFLFGFSLRLLRRFDEARSCLDWACQITAEEGNGFDAMRANCLMQIGDVERCQGRTDEAQETLASALDLAASMDMPVTQAFACSAIGAAQFQEGDPELARNSLAAAQELFDRVGHWEGIALNARRQATVARHLALAQVKIDASATKEAIRKALGAYRQLVSPTGIAACEIERGWLRWNTPSCGRVEPVVQRLGKLIRGMLGDPRRRQILLLDAWLPPMLQGFAEVVAPELLADAKKVSRRAEGNLIDQGEIGVMTINEGSHRRLRTEHKMQGSAKVIEMAGEAPRELTSLIAA